MREKEKGQQLESFVIISYLSFISLSNQSVFLTRTPRPPLDLDLLLISLLQFSSTHNISISFNLTPRGYECYCLLKTWLRSFSRAQNRRGSSSEETVSCCCLEGKGRENRVFFLKKKDGKSCVEFSSLVF